MMTRYFLLVTLTTTLGCGIGSVSPVISGTDTLSDPRLVGTWQGGKESAVISASPSGGYDILYTDDDSKAGRFHGHLGRIGSFKVLDVQPADPLPAASDTYKSLLLLAHGIIIIDSIGDTLEFRIPRPDSLRAYLKKHPQAVSHTIVRDHVLLTAPLDLLNRFLGAYLARRGVLDERNVWHRATDAR